ncbi:alpha/beta hydrolase [Priestia flexa]|uniref:alpha/beta hydrolase n=1 Tax=Priestia flexa TaxID=86664 RepID=UPI00240CF1F1|nr:alpha/beta hydrolase [Priestia flexa]WEZ10116.1 alpha/beta hydrolase [Priestia flexa]
MVYQRLIRFLKRSIYYQKNTKIVKLKGANNAQFGLYGEQIGDNKATISPEEQQKQMVQQTVQWLNEQIK